MNGSMCVYRLKFQLDARPGDVIEAVLTEMKNIIIY